MKIQYASDLHLEYSHNIKYLKANPLQPNGEVLVLAGDVMPFVSMNKHEDFIDYLSDHFKMTYWLPGNHDYYNFDLAEKNGRVDETIRSNVRLVNNIVIQQDEIRFLFSTLWSKIDLSVRELVQKRIRDFQSILFKGKYLEVSTYNALHIDCLTFLERELHRADDMKTVVVTHHVPTMNNYPERHLDSVMTQAFGVELRDLIVATEPSTWIYGHHHFNTPDFNIGATQMVTNQLGYVKYGGEKYFNAEEVLML